jgi:demethylspheroidene O-methyltransferase
LPSLHAAWQARRDSWLSSPRFQRRVLRWPLLRGIARRRALALFDLCAGFVYSQVLAATVELELCERVAARPLSIAELEAGTGVPAAAVRRLAKAAASLRLLEDRGDDTFGLGPLGAALTGNPMIRAMVEHHGLLYEDLADPVARLRQPDCPSRLADFWAYANRTGRSCTRAETEPYSALMSASQAMVADEILAAYPVAAQGHWLDVAGGNGELMIRLAHAEPALRGTCFDLPSVAAEAGARFEALGLDGRLRAVGGDLFHDALPSGHDAALLVRVLHDHDDAAALRILASIRSALTPGALLLIAEPMSAPRARNRVADAYFAMYLLAMGQGRTRSARELTDMLEQVGFRRVRQRGTGLPMLLSILVAEA